MCKKVILVLFLCHFLSAYSQTSGCKDSIFNIELSQFICKQALMGDWKLDSSSLNTSHSIDSVFLDKTEAIWTFYPSGDLYKNHNGKMGQKVRETSHATFYKGSMILQNVVVGGMQVLTPEKYTIVKIDSKRLELLCLNNGKSIMRYILKKIK